MNNEENQELQEAKKKNFWNKRIVLTVEIFLTLITFLLFVFGVYIENSLVEGIFSNCFTALIVTLLGTIIEWNTETDIERAVKSVEEETKKRIEDIQVSTFKITENLNSDLKVLQNSIDSFSNVVELYSGKSCTFCKNSIKAVKFNRNECNLEQFFSQAQQSVCILATNLESFVPYLNIFSELATRGVHIKVATIHPNFARDFNISNVVGYTGSEKRWRDMKDSLIKFLTFSESDSYGENKIEIRTYTTITPTLILMIVDNDCYVSYLLHGHRSRETPHFLFSGSDNSQMSPFNSFKKHFDGIWNDPGTIECSFESIASLRYEE